MTLKQFVDQCGEDGQVDGIAAAAVKLGVGYHTVYALLKGNRKPGRLTLRALHDNGITV